MKSIRDFFSRQEGEQAELAQLKQDAKAFKLPSVVIPEAVKYAVFFTTAVFSVGLFQTTLIGWRAWLTSTTAVGSEALVLYCYSAFPRSAGAFRKALGTTGVLLSILALTHSTLAVIHFTAGRLDSATWTFYAHFVAFPLLMCSMAIGSIAILLTHPKKEVQLAEADAHTKMLVNKAQTASRLALIEGNKALDLAQVEEARVKNEHEAMLLDEVEKRIQIEERKIARVMAIKDPDLRHRLARELGVTLPSLPPGVAAQRPSTGEWERWRQDQQGERGSSH